MYTHLRATQIFHNDNILTDWFFSLNKLIMFQAQTEGQWILPWNTHLLSSSLVWVFFFFFCNSIACKLLDRRESLPNCTFQMQLQYIHTAWRLHTAWGCLNQLVHSDSFLYSVKTWACILQSPGSTLHTAIIFEWAAAIDDHSSSAVLVKTPLLPTWQPTQSVQDPSLWLSLHDTAGCCGELLEPIWMSWIAYTKPPAQANNRSLLCTDFRCTVQNSGKKTGKMHKSYTRHLRGQVQTIFMIYYIFLVKKNLK